MLVKNLDVEKGLVNGARGVVIGWDATRKDYPIVRFTTGLSKTIEPIKWTVEISGEPVAVSIALLRHWSAMRC